VERKVSTLEELVKRIKALFFDLDGTLINSTNQIFQAVSQTRKELGYSATTLSQVELNIGLHAKELFRNLGLNNHEEALVIGLFRQNLASIKLDQSNLFDGVFELLTWARDTEFRMAVATNKPRHLATKVLEETGIAKFFEHVEGSDYLPPKPHPAIINRCLDVLKVEKHLVCMVGDRVEDTLAAKASGVKAISVIQGTHTAEAHIGAGAEKTFPNFVSLLDYFKAGGTK
jgi:phosphoglycolate phosphatase